METYTIAEGNHFSFPRLFKFTFQPREIAWKVIFNEDCNYVLRTETGEVSVDQKDWNKLCGSFFSLLSTRNDTAMIGWRYNIEEDLIELAPYYHVSGSRDMFPPLLSVKRGKLVEVRLYVDWDEKTYRWTLTSEEVTQEHEMKFSHNWKLSGFINFYFGGNMPAPQQVSVQMEVEVVE